ncbi:alpha-ketoglutarate-dependent taurine dioxygenase [Chytriomyces sp. MP71]|nr:alpha-ketoglutarate-dependent taurine dioxygenase [Chytriomyces sp. MP71]
MADLPSFGSEFYGKPGYPALPHQKYPPLEDYEYVDVALKADPEKASVLNIPGATFKKLEPAIGTEVTGVQLNKLNEQQRRDLALLVAERGVVFLRAQDASADELLDIGRFFGRLHIHPTSRQPEGYPELHVVYNDPESTLKARDALLDSRRRRYGWHSDVTYERQPPTYTLFKVDVIPPTGGSTLWASQVKAYETLTPAFQKIVEGLTAVHSAVEQAEFSRKTGGPVRREPVETEHPVVRTHPVTGKKALFVNPGFTRYIVGLKPAESDAILDFLYDHIKRGIEFQVRYRWEANTVAIWDNRQTVHTANPDYILFGEGPQYRNAYRVTPQGERPYLEKGVEE